MHGNNKTTKSEKNSEVLWQKKNTKTEMFLNNIKFFYLFFEEWTKTFTFAST